MISPYYQGLVRADWGPPAGLSQTIASGGEAIGRGLASIGSSIGNAIEKRAEFKAHANVGKSMLDAVATNPEKYGMNADQVKTLQTSFNDASLSAKAMYPEMLMKNIQMQDMASQMGERNSIGKWRQQQADAMALQQANARHDAQSFDTLAKNFNVTPPELNLTGDGIMNFLTQPGMMPGTPARGDQLGSLVQNFSAANPSSAMRMGLLDKAIKNGSGEDVVPRSTTILGRKIIFNPRTGNFQTVDDPNSTPVEVIDDLGNVIGHNIPNGKGGLKFVGIKKTTGKFPADTKFEVIKGVNMAVFPDGSKEPLGVVAPNAISKSDLSQQIVSQQLSKLLNLKSRGVTSVVIGLDNNPKEAGWFDRKFGGAKDIDDLILNKQSLLSGDSSPNKVRKYNPETGRIE